MSEASGLEVLIEQVSTIDEKVSKEFHALIETLKDKIGPAVGGIIYQVNNQNFVRALVTAKKKGGYMLTYQIDVKGQIEYKRAMAALKAHLFDVYISLKKGKICEPEDIKNLITSYYNDLTKENINKLLRGVEKNEMIIRII